MVQRVEAEQTADVVRVLQEGGVIAYAAETVYGLGCRADQPAAIERVKTMKGRGTESPFLVLVADPADLEGLVSELSDSVARFLNTVWPGPITVILPGVRDTYKLVASASGTLGVRLPDDEALRSVIRSVGLPLVSTSANRSGSPVAQDASSVLQEFGEELDLVWDRGPRGGEGSASAVIDFGSGKPVLLREGPTGLTVFDPTSWESVTGDLEIPKVLVLCSGNTCRSAMAQTLIASEAKRQGVPLAVLSAGTSAMSGQRASEGAQKAMKEIGLDLSLHRSQAVNDELLRGADVILVMEQYHREYVMENFGSVGEKAVLYSQYAGEGKVGIFDPWGGDEKAFRLTRDVLAKYTEKIVKEIQRCQTEKK